jgi:hypothetical protein
VVGHLPAARLSGSYGILRSRISFLSVMSRIGVVVANPRSAPAFYCISSPDLLAVQPTSILVPYTTLHSISTTSPSSSISKTNGVRARV